MINEKIGVEGGKWLLRKNSHLVSEKPLFLGAIPKK